MGAFLFAKSSALRYTNSIKIAVGGRGGIPHVQIAHRQVFQPHLQPCHDHSGAGGFTGALAALGVLVVHGGAGLAERCPEGAEHHDRAVSGAQG